MNTLYKIQRFRQKGYTYKEIARKLGLSISAIYTSAHPPSEESRRAAQKVWKQKAKARNPFFNKMKAFNKSELKNIIYGKYYCFSGEVMSVKEKDVMDKVGLTPICYLTGDCIDVWKPETYSFDHIVPKSRGGKSDIDNLGICTKEVNQAKSDKTPQEFIELCKKVLIHNGFNISTKL